MFKEELASKKSIKTNLRGVEAINYYIKKPFIARKMKFSITKISDLFACTKEILTEKTYFLADHRHSSLTFSIIYCRHVWSKYHTTDAKNLQDLIKK